MKRINPIVFVYFTILSINYGLKETPFEFPNVIEAGLVAVMCVLFLLHLFKRKFGFTTFMNIVLLGGLTLITLYTTRNPNFLLSVMSAIILSSVNYMDVLKLIFVERLCINLFVNLCSILGLIQNVKYVAKSGVMVQCYSLGYNHANKFACVVGMLILLYLCIKQSELNFKHIIIISTIMYGTYMISKTRTFLIVMLPLVVVLVLLNGKGFFREFTKKGIYIFAKWIIPICYVIGIGVPYLMASDSELIRPWTSLINYMTSERFLHASRVVSLYPIKLFGGVTNFQLLFDNYNYSVIDSGYIRLLYGYGIVGTVLFALFYMYTIKKLIEREEIMYLVAIIIIAIWGISENVLYSSCYNFTILLWAETLDSTIRRRKKHGKIRFVI